MIITGGSSINAPQTMYKQNPTLCNKILVRKEFFNFFKMLSLLNHLYHAC